LSKSEKGKDIPSFMFPGLAWRIRGDEKCYHVLPDSAVSSQVLNRFATVVLEFLQMIGG
jgi:hypothetical protein